MDLQLLKTFIEVASTRSFAAASDRLYVTQSAVSLRVQRLEQQLGRALFTRSKGGVALTPAGKEFSGFAATILRSWEQARLRVTSADDAEQRLTIGAQVSLWPRFGFDWMDRLRAACPDLALRAEMGSSEGLLRGMTERSIQIALTYAPLSRAGLRSTLLMEEDLVMVAQWENPTVETLGTRYVMVDWGEEFQQFHDAALPHLANPLLTLDLGTLSARYLKSRPFAAYLPARYAKRYVDLGQMFLVPDAPTHPHPSWVIWREDLSAELAEVANTALQETVAQATSDARELLDLIDV